MDKRTALITELKRFKKDLSKEVPIKKMILFGSQATGKTHKWSDVDLLIVSGKFKRKKAYQRLRGLYDHWHAKKPVDFLCYTPKEFNKLKGETSLVRNIAKKGIKI
ncbi:MAG: nucleotidyltransferase domain-containing protein [Nanoarchaeota archaeon]